MDLNILAKIILGIIFFLLGIIGYFLNRAIQKNDEQYKEVNEERICHLVHFL